MNLSERFKFDDENNIVTIDGCRVAVELMECFTRPSPPGQWFRIINADGISTIQMWRTEAGPATPEVKKAT